MCIFHAINKVALAIVLVIMIAVVAFVLTFVYTVPGTPKITTSFSTSSFSSTNLNTNQSSATGLQLVISVNSTVIRPGGSVNLSVSARNILSTPNNKSSASDWALPTLGQGFGPCTPLNNSPFRIAAFMGYYTMQNVSEARALTVVNPVGAYSCTAISQFVYLIFQPDSNNVEVYGCFGSSCQTQGTFQMNNSYFESYFQIGGYWTNSSSTSGTTTQTYSFHPLGDGSYTVAVGDEWGDLTLLHFLVATGSTGISTTSSSSGICTFPGQSLGLNLSILSDSTLAPIDGANVTALYTFNGSCNGGIHLMQTVQSFVTNSTGWYILMGLNNGNFTIIVSYSDHIYNLMAQLGPSVNTCAQLFLPSGKTNITFSPNSC